MAMCIVVVDVVVAGSLSFHRVLDAIFFYFRDSVLVYRQNSAHDRYQMRSRLKLYSGPNSPRNYRRISLAHLFSTFCHDSLAMIATMIFCYWGCSSDDVFTSMQCTHRVRTKHEWKMFAVKKTPLVLKLSRLRRLAHSCLARSRITAVCKYVQLMRDEEDSHIHTLAKSIAKCNAWISCRKEHAATDFHCCSCIRCSSSSSAVAATKSI